MLCDDFSAREKRTNEEELTCPVCGMDVTGAGDINVEHSGFTYRFCSMDCQRVFLRAPGTYLGMQRQCLHERAHELELVRKETLECLSRAAEFNDNETGKHTLRIGAYSYRLAVMYGLPFDYAMRIRETAPMHDVGKIGVPEHILLKSSALDVTERSIIAQHPEMGAKILGTNLRSEIMQMAARIAISHHEKWDGSGYPYSLKQEEIPIEGRIVAVSDVFDALMSKRPYKPAWPPKKVLALMESEQGTHFDPMLAKLFVQHFSVFKDIYEQFRDSADNDDQR